MRKLIAILVIVICLAAFAMPVIADKEDKGVSVDITIAAATTTPGSPSGEPELKHGMDDLTATVTTTTRETRQAEWIENQSGRDNSNILPGRTISQVREDNRREHEVLNATLMNVSADQREQIRNQNEVRIAVHSLLEMENLSGGIRREVSAIARDFNTSASSLQVLEDRIQTRNTILHLFFGGDREAAGARKPDTTKPGSDPAVTAADELDLS